MATLPQPKPSFSPYRKWRIGFHVCVMIVVVLSVVVMVNYLSRRHSWRFYLNERAEIQLYSRTLKLLEKETHEGKGTIYYLRKEEVYSTITDLVNAYAPAKQKNYVTHVCVQ